MHLYALFLLIARRWLNVFFCCYSTRVADDDDHDNDEDDEDDYDDQDQFDQRDIKG